jgi:hypothetical protein
MADWNCAPFRNPRRNAFAPLSRGQANIKALAFGRWA